METDGENDRAQRPVGKHTDPDSNRAESPYPAEINAQAYPAQPHGAAGGDHGEFYVTCSAHAIGWDKGKYPDRKSTRLNSSHPSSSRMPSSA